MVQANHVIMIQKVVLQTVRAYSLEEGLVQHVGKQPLIFFVDYSPVRNS